MKLFLKALPVLTVNPARMVILVPLAKTVIPEAQARLDLKANPVLLATLALPAKMAIQVVQDQLVRSVQLVNQATMVPPAKMAIQVDRVQLVPLEPQARFTAHPLTARLLMSPPLTARLPTVPRLFTLPQLQFTKPHQFLHTAKCKQTIPQNLSIFIEFYSSFISNFLFVSISAFLLLKQKENPL